MKMQAVMVGTLFEQEEIDKKKNFYNIAVKWVLISPLILLSRLGMSKVESDSKEHLQV